MLPSFLLFATDVLAAHDGIQLIARHWEVKCLAAQTVQVESSQNHISGYRESALDVI
jgi:hypothetical protein